MNRSITLVLLVAMSLTIASNGCKKDDSPVSNTAAKADQIFPLKIGNQWILQVTNYDRYGNPYHSELDTVTILCDTMIQSEQWFVGYGIRTNRSDGLYDYQPASAEQASLQFKFPTSVNASYTYRGTQVRVLGISDTISVSAGKYVCYHYRTGIDTVSYTDSYYAPNVGLIKSESFNQGGYPGVFYRYLHYNLVSAIIK
jgi:hypothetical protein